MNTIFYDDQGHEVDRKNHGPEDLVTIDFEDAVSFRTFPDDVTPPPPEEKILSVVID